MKLDRVTITGADDSVERIFELADISEMYPFVEWGILVSESHTFGGCERFPSADWIGQLQNMAATTPMQLSLHICGKWTRELLVGNLAFAPDMLRGFERLQLNSRSGDTRPEKIPCHPTKFMMALHRIGNRQVIFQADNAEDGNSCLEDIWEDHDPNGVLLFDMSGGTGTLPEKWPKPIYMENDTDYAYHGYAGGLAPDNLETELPLIAKAAGNCRVWIDMETGVRTLDGRALDLAKVRRCLDICKPWVAGCLE